MCVGSNMNSDGFTHTDQAAATLQVQGEMSGMLRSLESKCVCVYACARASETVCLTLYLQLPCVHLRHCTNACSSSIDHFVITSKAS